MQRAFWLRIVLVAGLLLAPLSANAVTTNLNVVTGVEELGTTELDIYDVSTGESVQKTTVTGAGETKVDLEPGKRYASRVAAT